MAARLRISSSESDTSKFSRLKKSFSETKSICSRAFKQSHLTEISSKKLREDIEQLKKELRRMPKVDEIACKVGRDPEDQAVRR